ncbi:MAG: hypothetical protein R3D00_22840 [Bacteroidia bacterium]
MENYFIKNSKISILPVNPNAPLALVNFKERYEQGDSILMEETYNTLISVLIESSKIEYELGEMENGVTKSDYFANRMILERRNRDQLLIEAYYQPTLSILRASTNLQKEDIPNLLKEKRYKDQIYSYFFFFQGIKGFREIWYLWPEIVLDSDFKLFLAENSDVFYSIFSIEEKYLTKVNYFEEYGDYYYRYLHIENIDEAILSLKKLHAESPTKFKFQFELMLKYLELYSSKEAEIIFKITRLV